MHERPPRRRRPRDHGDQLASADRPPTEAGAATTESQANRPCATSGIVTTHDPIVELLIIHTGETARDARRINRLVGSFHTTACNVPRRCSEAAGVPGEDGAELAG